MNETNNIKKARVMGFGLAAIGALMMSLDPIFIRYAGVSGFDTAFLFGLFGAISMPLVLKFSDKRGIRAAVRQSGLPLVFAALLMLGSSMGLVFSIKHTSIANTFIILSATPALTAIFSWLFLKEKVTRSTMLAIVFVMIGVGVVVSGSLGSGNWFGDALAIFSVTCVSLMFALLRKYQNVSRLAAVGLGSLLLAVVMYQFATPSEYSTNTWLIMAAMGLLTAPAGRVFSMVSTRYITAPEVSMTLMLETVLAPIWGFIFFSEIPVLATVVGGGVILITLVFYTISTLKSGE